MTDAGGACEGVPGELVPAEAELARRDGREYEPAAVLLERIRAERAGAGRTSGRRGRRVGARLPLEY